MNDDRADKIMAACFCVLTLAATGLFGVLAWGIIAGRVH